ncbi:Spc98 family-domain-containing protein [Aspergillus desertorum]
MAATGTLTSTTELLIAAVAKTTKDTARFRALKRRVDEALKTPLHGRTDQFAVAKQLEGLLEKFRILSRDDLADALQPRLAELNERSGTVFPEILSFLLQLADRPAQLAEVDRLVRLQPAKEEKQLFWTDLDASGAAYCDEDIWENIDYGASSSDDDEISSVSSGIQAARSFTEIAPEDYVIPNDIFCSGEDEDLLTSIKSVQFWREENRPHHTESAKISSRELTELQIAREAIFMLQGLPTSLLWRLDGSLEIDRSYTLSHLSREALSSVLRSICACGTKIDILRRFTRVPQSTAYMQTFRRSIEDCLHTFDRFLSDVQSRFLSGNSSVVISLLQLSDDVQRESKLLTLLADLVSTLEQTAVDEVQCLDSLFDLVCITQAAGDDENFALLAEIFFASLETYSRPLYRWMKTGQLEDSSLFFVSENREKNDLRTLWHDWYLLETQSELAKIPKFIRPFAHKTFITGKSMVFLKRLNIADNLEAPGKTVLSFEDIYPSDSSSLCLPFYALLDSAFSDVVNRNHAFTSSLLRKELNEQCGLWISLQALEHIHLCRDISLIGPIDAKIFELIDRRKGGWSDRFLLTELAQTAFGSLPFIDPTRLIVRSERETDNRSRSVKILSSLSFDYILPWPVANIITKDGIAAYQRVSTFLMQIRRAKYTIVTQRLQYFHHDSNQTKSARGQTLSYAIRHNLLWFLNVLYSHLTGFVISSTTQSLHKSLSSANDVDAMIAAHCSFTASLDEQCLLSKNLQPLHQATLSILDLCISFADLHVTRSQHRTQHLDPTRIPRGQAPGRPVKTGLSPTNCKSRYEYSYSDEEDTDEEHGQVDSEVDEEYEAEDDISEHHGASLQESQYVQRLRGIQEQFNRLVAFMAAGLKSVGRVDGQVSWEMLAEKLEWRKERAAGWC